MDQFGCHTRNKLLARPTGWTLLICALAVSHFISGSSEAALLGNGEEARAEVVRIYDAPRIDGNLEDPVWQQVPPIGGLTQFEPREAVPPTFQTEIRLAHDGKYLYAYIRCFDDDPSKIIATKLTRDSQFETDDRVTLLFDTFHDRRNGYMFQLTPTGARMDGLSEANRQFRREWDGIWDAKARIDSKGWAVEVRIPFQTLNFDPEKSTWGFNVLRVIRRLNERSRWTNFYQNRSFMDVANAGVLTGLEGLEQGLGLDVVTSGTVRRQHEHKTSRDFTGIDPSLDVFYKLTPSITGVATFNTDFAENFADDRQINITRFDKFFPETRDFFLQDAGIFDGFGGVAQNGRPYFSRNIGLRLEDLGLVQPPVVPIRAGLKVSGRAGPLNLGILGSHTDSIGDIERKNLGIARLSYNILGESSIGLVATRGDPSQNRDNTLYGIDFNYRNSQLSNGNTMTGDFWFQRSSTTGMSGDSLGWGAKIAFPNDKWNGHIGVYELEENFFPGLGFINRVGIRRYDAVVRRRWRPQNWLRTVDSKLNAMVVTGDDREIQSSRFWWQAIDLANQAGDSFEFDVVYRTEELEAAFDIATGVTMNPQRKSWYGWKVSLETANSRPVDMRIELAWGDFWNGDMVLWRGWWNARPSKHLTINIFYEEYDVALPEGDFTKRLVRARTISGINPDLSIESLTQYDNVQKSLGFQIRLHWIMQPGNDLYLIVGQDFDADGDGLRGSRTSGVAKVAWTHRF